MSLCHKKMMDGIFHNIVFLFHFAYYPKHHIRTRGNLKSLRKKCYPPESASRLFRKNMAQLLGVTYTQLQAEEKQVSQ